MKPVFKEEMEFLGIDSKYENLLWVHHRCYYAFDKQFQQITFGRKIESLPEDVSSLISFQEMCEYIFSTSTREKVERERERS